MFNAVQFIMKLNKNTYYARKVNRGKMNEKVIARHLSKNIKRINGEKI